MAYDQEIRDALERYGQGAVDKFRPSENVYTHDPLPLDQIQEMKQEELLRNRGMMPEEPQDPMGMIPFRHSSGDPRAMSELDANINRIIHEYGRDTLTQTPNQIVANEEQEFGDAEMSQFTEMLEAFKRGGGTPVVEMPTTTPRTAGPTRTPRTWRDY